MIPISYILTPLAGAIIGYITNDMAIRMLFHPYEAKYLFGFKIPFTPGLIPKEKDHMAESIAQMISEKLMTEEVLRENLLSEDVIDKIGNTLSGFLTNLQNDQDSIHQKASSFLGEEEMAGIEQRTIDSITDVVSEKLTNNGLGQQIADMAIGCFRQNANFIESIYISAKGKSLSQQIAETVSDLLTVHARPLAYDMIKTTIGDFLNTPVSGLLANKQEQLDAFKNAAIRLYRNTITEKLPKMMETINVQQMVENKIKEMDVKEMEDLIFGIMDKELKAIVWLGALLGFLMGFVTLGLNQIA